MKMTLIKHSIHTAQKAAKWMNESVMKAKQERKEERDEGRGKGREGRREKEGREEGRKKNLNTGRISFNLSVTRFS